MVVWILFKTDESHTTSSREIIGIFTLASEMIDAMLENGATKQQVMETIASEAHRSCLSGKGYEFEREPRELNKYDIL